MVSRTIVVLARRHVERTLCAPPGGRHAEFVSRIATDHARAQMARILQYASLGIGGAAVVASSDGSVLMIAPNLPREFDAGALGRAVLSDSDGTTHVDWISRDAALVTEPGSDVPTSVAQHYTSKALGLLRRMATQGRRAMGPGGDDPGSGAPASVSVWVDLPKR